MTTTTSHIITYKHHPSGGYTSPGLQSCTSPSLDGLLHWLIFSASPITTSPTRVVWSLSDFTHPILDQLPSTTRTELSRPPHRARWGNYRLYLIPDKVFSLNKNGSEVNIYDLSQYYPDQPEPLSLSSLQEKVDLLQTVLTDLGITSPPSLSSPVAAFRGHNLLPDTNTIPTIFDAPESHLGAYETALQCTPREWVSNYQIGHFPDLWGYDITSAYAAHAARLLDLRDCRFTRSANLDLSAYYGFLTGDFTVYPDHPLAFCSPFLADRGDGVLVNFTGTARDYPCLLDEVRMLYRHDMGEFKFRDGWFISPHNGVRPRFPFREPMGQLYEQRGENGNKNSDEVAELRSYLLKRVMTGIVGRLLETRKDNDGNIIEYGSLYNPLYHAVCTTRTRLQVFQFLADHNITQDELVHVGVDGVKAMRELPLPASASMGKWRCSGSDPAVVLSPGAVLSPHRNFKGTRYEELVVECLARPGASVLGSNPNDPIDLRRLFVNQTRIFPQLPKTGKALLDNIYQSAPVML